MDVQEAYNHWAGTYDPTNNPTRDLDQTATREMLKHLRFDVTLETGCGTGKNTPLLSQISKTVHCFDFSAEMIKRAQQKQRSGNVSFAVADITQKWPLSDGSADFITCNLVLEHIEDLSFIFSEASRVLVGDGRLFVSEFHPYRQYQGKTARFEHHGQDLAIPAFVHNISDFTRGAETHGFVLDEMKEWWHPREQEGPPRIVSFMFRKQ